MSRTSLVYKKKLLCSSGLKRLRKKRKIRVLCPWRKGIKVMLQFCFTVNDQGLD